MTYRCTLHPSTIITHFCETCLDLVCESCVQKQPHSGSTHTIKQIPISSQMRKTLYSTFIDKQINPIRSKSQKKIVELHQIRKQLEKQKKIIEKDIIIQFEGINNRLTDKLSLAIIAKQTEIKHLQNYVYTFDDISSAFDSVYSNPQAVLISYRTLDSQLKRMQSLQYNLDSAIDKKPDLSREFASTQSRTLSITQYIDRNDFLNKLICSYISSINNKKQQIYARNVQEQTISELTFNNTFIKAVSDQDAKFCPFCNTPFSIEAVNDQCANNRTFKLNCLTTDVSWEAVIPENMRGTKRHYWYKSDSLQRKKPTVEQHSLVKKQLKKHYWNALLELEILKYALKGYEIEQRLPFQSVAASHNSETTGFMSKISFIYVLSKLYLVPRSQIDTLISLLETDKEICYSRLNEILNNITQDYYKFCHDEEQFEKSKPVAPRSGIFRGLF